MHNYKIIDKHFLNQNTTKDEWTDITADSVDGAAGKYIHNFYQFKPKDGEIITLQIIDQNNQTYEVNLTAKHTINYLFHTKRIK